MFSNSVLLSQGCLGDFESFTFFHVNPGVNFGICYDLQKKSAVIVDLCYVKNSSLLYTLFKQLHQNGRFKQQFSRDGMGKTGVPKSLLGGLQGQDFS